MSSVVRVADGGQVLQRVGLRENRAPFAVMLGGPDRRTLFILTAEWRPADGHVANLDRLASGPRTGEILTLAVAVPGAGRPRLGAVGDHMQRSGRLSRERSVVELGRTRTASQADAAFEEFVQSRSAHLLRLALLLTGWNAAVAEDLTQAVLERAYGRRRALFGAEQAAEPYVRRMLVNASIDWRRGLRRRGELPLDAAAHLEASDRSDAVADRDLLIRALAGLPPRQRAVLVLRYWEDLSDAEIAAALNCAVGTVRSQASRGLERLRRATDLRPGPASELSTTGEHDE